MSRARILIWPLMVALVTPGIAAGGQVALGQYRDWAAFRQTAPRSCRAIAEPVTRLRTPGAFVAVTSLPARGSFRQVQVRLRRPAVAAVLAIGDRRFPLRLTGRDGGAWTAGDNARIAALMRDHDSLRVTARSDDGRRFTDVYALAGAASAIDAAGIGCIG